MMLRAFSAIAFVAALLCTACTNSDDYLYSESDATFIEVSAEMAYSFDSVSERIKMDTLHPGDSLIFIANILPSKSIRIKRYIWTVDGEPFSYDFSFRSAIWEPGLHKVVFILETSFGDTLSDTLTLQISSAPILLDSTFIPAKGTQGIPTTGGLSFAWNAYDPDSIASLFYHFTIDGLVDTILNVPYFTYWSDFKPLSHYRWHVQAINEFGFFSENTIEGSFFTSGNMDESGITGFFDISAWDPTNPFAYTMKLSILDTANNEVYNDSIKGSSQGARPFAISPLNEGSYKAIFSIPKYSDFTSDTINFTLLANEVLDLDTIRLRDTIAPTIAVIEDDMVNMQKDTLKYTDTLRFLITDFGSPQSKKTISAYLESELLTEKSNDGDTFTVVLPANMKTWNNRLLDIVAIDASKNRTTRNYTLEPTESWIKTNNSFTQEGPGKIDLYVIDSNPYGFSLSACKFLVNGVLYQAMDPTPLLCTVRITTDALEPGLNTIESIAVYDNEITQVKTWFITYISE